MLDIFFNHEYRLIFIDFINDLIKKLDIFFSFIRFKHNNKIEFNIPLTNDILVTLNKLMIKSVNSKRIHVLNHPINWSIRILHKG